MATGSGTGTPVSAAAAFTLSSLRARIRTQITAAESGIDLTPVAVSALTLTTMTDRIETVLQDSSNLIWATGDITEAIRNALEQYSRHKPDHAITTKTLTAAGREISITTPAGLIRVEKVWWDYDSATPGYPPTWRHFQVWPGSILYIDDTSEPAVGDILRIWYTKEHTLNLLDSATATTFPVEDESFLIHGAASFCARFRAIELAEKANVDDKVTARLMDWADKAMSEFREGLTIRDWKSYTMTFDQNDIDEAVRWALGRYNDVNPETIITSVTLTADGREVDISSITDYLDIMQVWWDYDSSAPEYPPKWRSFELWPGDKLFIKSDDEPQSGDVVRIWYTRPRAINGLDSAAATTLEADAETLIVIGSSAFVCEERIQDEEQRYVPRKLRDWASARKAEFERGLHQLARRQAARHSGVTPIAWLDRWDKKDGGW